ASQDFFPEVHFFTDAERDGLRAVPAGPNAGRYPRIVRAKAGCNAVLSRLPAANPPKIGLNRQTSVKRRDFPQFFPQVWKTLGRDQTCMRSLGVRRTMKDADCSTKRPRLTPSEPMATIDSSSAREGML